MSTSRVGVCSWSVRPGYPRDLIETVRRLRLGAVQLALVPVLRQPGAWGGAVAELSGAGIEVPSGMLAVPGEDYSTLETIRATGGLRRDEAWPAARRLAGEAARHAGDAGIPLVTLHAGFLPEDRGDPARAAMLDRLRTVADVFAGHGVALGLETGQETADTLLGVLDDLDRPNVGVNFDPANMILYGMGDPAAALRRLAPRVRQVHVKDAVPAREPGAWGTETPAGRGAVDWDALFDIALSIDPPVDFMIEREAGDEREPDIAAARDLVARYLRE